MYEDAFVIVETPENVSMASKLASVKKLLAGSFYIAKLDRYNSRDEVVVKVPNSVNPVEELQQFFYNRLAKCFVVAM